MANHAPEYMRHAMSARRRKASDVALPVVVTTLRKDGLPSRVHGATTRHAGVDTARKRIDYWRRVNPGRSLRYAIDGVEA